MRFVVLRHELPAGSARASHWDVMFEVDADGPLKTWAIELAPDSSAAQPALALPDHRREYLTYEGPVSDNRGHVQRWDAGTYELLAPTTSDPRAFVAHVHGEKLHGLVRLSAQYAYEAAQA